MQNPSPAMYRDHAASGEMPRLIGELVGGSALPATAKKEDNGGTRGIGFGRRQ